MRIGFVITLLAVAFLMFQSIDKNAMASAQPEDVRKTLPMDVSFEQSQAGTLLNGIRQAVNLGTLSRNGTLARAAQAHADYMVANRSASHYETEGKPYFTGKAPLDRAYRTGYQASFVSENLSANNDDAQNSLDGLFAAIYHRFGFLSPKIDELGIGVTQDPADSQNSAFVYVMGNSELNRVCSSESFHGSGNYIYGVCRDKAHRIAQKTYQKVMSVNQMNNPKIILYPYDGQQEVPLAFYNESPDPLPDYDVSGFPVSIEFNDYYIKKATILSFKLFDEDNEEVKVRSMDKASDPHRRFTSLQFALFPLTRLDFDKKYRVEAAYCDEKGVKEISWSFHTRRPMETLHVITEREAHVQIRAG